MQILLYPPSERSETGGYTVFTIVCLCVRAHSVQSSTVCVPPTTHQPSPSWRTYALSEHLIVDFVFSVFLHFPFISSSPHYCTLASHIAVSVKQRPFIPSTVALYTQLDAECDQQLTTDGFFYVCVNFGENRSRNATVNTDDRQIDAQTQTGFIIFPTLYAIRVYVAMGQIIRWPGCHRLTS